MQTNQHPITSTSLSTSRAIRAIATCVTCLCAIALLWSAAPLAQAKAKESGAPTSVTVSKPKKPPKIKMEKGSGENTAERDRRLLRECKGRPNAGACLGYTG